MTTRIPESLGERVRAGRAALVVGSNIGALAGMPSWKKVLERLVSELEKRGKPGDKEAADDVATLLKKGRIVNAAGFLARFRMDPYRRDMLLRGLDEIGRTLKREDLIAAFERGHDPIAGRPA